MSRRENLIYNSPTVEPKLGPVWLSKDLITTDSWDAYLYKDEEEVVAEIKRAREHRMLRMANDRVDKKYGRSLMPHQDNFLEALALPSIDSKLGLMSHREGEVGSGLGEEEEEEVLAAEEIYVRIEEYVELEDSLRSL